MRKISVYIYRYLLVERNFDAIFLLKGVVSLKKYLLSLICLFLMATAASAEVLSSALPNPPGVLSIALMGARQYNAGNNSSLYQTIYGVGIAYGLCDRTELDLIYEYGVFSGIPGMEMMLNMYSATIKYNLLMEAPISIALGTNYTLLCQKDNFMGSPSGNSYGLKILASKVISHFIPYLCLNRTYSSLAGNSNATEVTLGGMWLVTKKWTCMVENTWQMQNTGYTSSQVSLCAAYTL